MRRLLYVFLFTFSIAACTVVPFNMGNLKSRFLTDSAFDKKDDEEEDNYDGAAARDLFEVEQKKDRKLGYVPMDRMQAAVDYTQTLQKSFSASKQANALAALTWTERGPIYDLVGASGNSRGSNVNYTAGRILGVLIDTLNDPTGNIVFAGSASGGLWKCTNFLSQIPNWQSINDKFDNLAISSICQDPTNPQIMYFSTGEGTSNVDAVYGGGVWKSVDGGNSWSKLSSSTGFIRSFKIACDASGNIYIANRNSAAPSSANSLSNGLYRSKDGGATWQNITPSGLTSTNTICTDFEISSTGRLHASFGYTGSKVQHVYTTTPATVTTSTWSTSYGIRLSSVAAYRMELATQGNIVYAVTVNTSSQLDSCYKSVDGGATFTKQNTTAFTTGILNGQGWYNLTLAINPNNAAEIVVGGLDLYKSTNSGATFPTRMTYWASGNPYVHADHHFMQWWNVGTQSRIIIGSDGGLFLSNDAGLSFVDKNRNLAIKQFYAGAIHPDAGSNYMLAGAQDNGVHQFTNAGLSWSTEVYGGDGMYVHINQQNPKIQFGSYAYATYRISTDGGATWSSNTIAANGLFVNPFDYDDGQNIMYASNGVTGTPNNQIVRWNNAHLSGPSTVFTVSALSRNSVMGNATAFKVSPYKKDRVFIGASNGRIVRLDNAGTVTSATIGANVTDISGTQLPNANINCINTGSSDDVLVATITNYGVAHVWLSTDAGTTWTSIDGNLPDMPVRWAMFDPQNDNKIMLATEAGVYSTDAINGSSTVWTANPGFPTIRTNMLKLRASDNTIIAATHGRGIYTAQLPSTPEVRFSAPFSVVTEASEGTDGCRSYKDYTVPVSITAAPDGDAVVTYAIDAGNTATEGSDFNFTTNGSFTSPSKQHVFVNGVAATKNITIRIYDDAEVESTESFKIRAVVSGATNAFTSTQNSHEITINDNDYLPALPVAPAYFNTGTYTVSLSTATAMRSNYAKHRVQYIFRASELLALGIPANSDLSELTMRVVTKNSTKPFTGYTISLGTTGAPTLYSDFIEGLIQVYKSDYTSVVGDNTFIFGTGAGSASSFRWNGTSNLIVQICFDNTPGTADALADVMEGSNPFGSTNTVSNVATALSDAINAGTGSGCSLESWNFSNSRVNMKFKVAVMGNPAETVLNSATTNSLNYATGDVPYYSSNSKTLGIIKSITPFDYGCTEIKIDRAGNGATAFTNNLPANYLMDKTYRITPATDNAAGQFKITFYYTAAEKAGWEVTTGQTWNNIKLVKVKSSITNYSPDAPAPDGANSIEVVTPVFGTFGNDYTLSYTFTGSLAGGYGAGIAPPCASPVITEQPAATTACVGLPTTLSVTASGASLFYQWRKNGVEIPNATSRTYTIAAASASDVASYDVVINGSCVGATVVSAPATLSLYEVPVITSQPLSQTICVGTNTALTVAATGSNISYKWQESSDGVNFTDVPNATSATLTLTNVQSSKQYRAILNYQTCTPVISETATVSLYAIPVITTQPLSQTICTGTNTSLSVVATGSGISYQWQESSDGVNFTDISNATSATLSLTAVQSSKKYRVVLNYETCTPVISEVATLSLYAVPVITTEPVSQTACVGSNASFTVAASGTNISYQWQESTDGVIFTNVPNATSATLSLTAVQASKKYRVLLNYLSCTPVASRVITLTANPLPVLTVTSTSSQILPGQIATISVISNPAAASYSWRYNGVPIANATGSSIQRDYTGIGNYSVSVVDINGCIKTSSNLELKVLQTEKLFVYPSPTKGIVHVQLYETASDIRSVSVYSASGVLIDQKQIEVGGSFNPYQLVSFDLSKHAAGVYTIVVTQKDNKRIASAKVLLAH